MTANFEAFGEWGKAMLTNAYGDDGYVVCGMRIADAKLATAALLGTLERVQDYPEGPLLEMHAAATRLQDAIQAWESACRTVPKEA